MSRNRLPKIIKNYTPKSRRNQGSDYWMCERRTGHKVVQLHNSYMMIMAFQVCYLTRLQIFNNIVNCK